MNRLKELREKKEVKQYDLAKLLNCSTNTISRYEIGSREPDYKTLGILADYFEVSTDYILGRTDIPTHLLFSSQEIQLLDDYRSLSSQGKEFIQQTMYAAIKTYKKDAGFSDMETANEITP